jgi:hypothetical protein
MNFKNVNGVWLTQGLFYETTTDKSTAVYSIEDLREKYLTIADPTEYRFATECLGGWDHWIALSEASFFQKYIEKWRNELEVKLRSAAVAGIILQANQGGRDSFQANKYLADRGYDNPRQTKGRPKKEDIARAATEMVADRRREADDYLRVIPN